MKKILKRLIFAVLFGNIASADDFDESFKSYEKAAKLCKKSL
jgi:hypothetical protein